MICEALSEALRDIGPWKAAIATDPQQAMLGYVSERHRDNISACCPIAALVNDVSRGTVQTREIYTGQVRRVFDLLEKSIAKEHHSDRRPQAMLAFSACVGAIALSRAVSDPELSKQILDGVARQLVELFEPRPKIK
ncbi:Transcriptional regulator, TetR family [Caballeronia sordidicola]|uniref:Transcriptional regulator, TetR family n=2 Tax=Burkholderiales TaxID=80840 RepID=A0A242M7K7_CABSO|nr:Transcriptional regulator, TetR family [Caballeronia sordidicola]